MTAREKLEQATREAGAFFDLPPELIEELVQRNLRGFDRYEKEGSHYYDYTRLQVLENAVEEGQDWFNVLVVFPIARGEEPFGGIFLAGIAETVRDAWAVRNRMQQPTLP